MLLKLADLLDTCFFILRKKMNHVSFLHVYHHTTMFILCWLAIKHRTCEEFSVMGAINTFVHIIMYTYYLLAALGPRVRKYLWWKRHLTIVQLIQFFLIFIHGLAGYFFNCTWSPYITYGVIIDVSIHIFLFGQFYLKTYKQQKVLDEGSKVKAETIDKNSNIKQQSNLSERNGLEKTKSS